ncbi:MAG: AAA family ATPase [Cyanobacteria bacterium]|nr:AAA family ATPase [Cyanobacteriota bacterium]
MHIWNYAVGMHGYFSRDAGATLAKTLARAPAALLLGPRQCGKSTLARQLLAQRGDAVILDLQDRADRARLQEPELFFEAHHTSWSASMRSSCCRSFSACCVPSSTWCWGEAG